MATLNSSYIVVGSGVFGASTALTLAQKYPLASVVLVDRAVPYRESASWDWTKVIRADYADMLYMQLALEAKEFVENRPIVQRILP